MSSTALRVVSMTHKKPKKTTHFHSTTRKGPHVDVGEGAIVEVQKLIRGSFRILQSLDQQLTLGFKSCNYVLVDVWW